MPSHLTGNTAPTGADASTARFSLTYFDPPKGLERHVLTLFHFACDDAVIEDRHPGALPQLFLTLRGRGEIRFGERREAYDGPAHMYSGFTTAAPFRVEGPWHAVGASLTPLGWAALTRQCAQEYVDHFIPAEALLGTAIVPFAQDIIARHNNGALLAVEACGELGDWIAANLHPVPPSHKAVIERTIAWLGSSLNPDVNALFGSLDYSRRQAERLIMHHFGFSPAALARRYRAIRAANLLAQSDISDEAESEIAAAFYDQPHMIREIRHHCGYTPTRLGGDSEPLFQTLLRLRNLDRLKDFRAIGSRD